MKHIQEILGGGQMSLFGQPLEKGSGEWSAFNAVRDDILGSYRVRVPQKPIVIHGGSHILRIIYPRLTTAH